MDKITKLVHLRKRSRADSLPHCAVVNGSADTFVYHADNSANLRGKIDDGRIKGLSSHALSRLRRAIAASSHVSGSYRCYGVCLTIPWADPSQEDAQAIWRDFVHHLDRFLGRWRIGGLYRVELQKRRATHWHILLYLPNDIDHRAAWDVLLSDIQASRLPAGASLLATARTSKGRPMIDALQDDCGRAHYAILSMLRLRWMIALTSWHSGETAGRALARMRECAPCPPPPGAIKTYDYCFNAICTDGLKSALAYLASHSTKHKQDQLGYTGKQWGYLGRKWLKESEPVPIVAPGQSREVVVRAYRLIRAWARRHARLTDWRVLRPSRRQFDDGSFELRGLQSANYRTLYIFGPTRHIIKRAFDCARGSV